MLVLAQPYQEVLMIPERTAWCIQAWRNSRSRGHAYADETPRSAATCPKKRIVIVFVRSRVGSIDASIRRCFVAFRTSVALRGLSRAHARQEGADFA
jgi:hypothetical protein